MKYGRFAIIVWAIAFAVACQQKASNERNENIVSILEVFQTARNEADNIDSPAFWQGEGGENWIISTAKTANCLVVDNALDGQNIKRVGMKGQGLGEFSRPNGIFVVENYAFVVERDNHRVQVLTIPGFESLGTFGDSLLIKPYGLFVAKTENVYAVFVTDNYEIEEDVIPPDSLLGKRVKKFSVSLAEKKVSAHLDGSFGEKSGPGVLRIVESVYGDTENNVLLIAEEEMSRSGVLVYDLSGNYLNTQFGNKIFKGQVEGITLYKGENGTGFWVVADQSHNENYFHIFDRKTFDLVFSFKGAKTSNTDGVCLTQKSFSGFPNGAFFAVNDDGNVSAFNLVDIINALP